MDTGCRKFESCHPDHFYLYNKGDLMYNMWEEWFAWHPVMIEDEWVWLKTIERREEWTFPDCYHPCGKRIWEYQYKS